MPPPPQYYSAPQRSWFPWLVPLIFIANIAMFVASMYENNCPAKMDPGKCVYHEYLGRFSFQPTKENPLLGPSVETLKSLGGLDRDLVVKKDEIWRMFSCMWLHGGTIHLLINMISLLFIGIGLEREFGFWRIGIVYVLSGLGGSLMSALAYRGTTSSISVGASGALFGLLGAMLSELITNWASYANKCSALVSLVVVIGINLALGFFLPNFDNSAHIGGIVSGFFLGFILLMHRDENGYEKPKFKCYQHIFWAISLVVLIIGYIVGFTKLFKGETVQIKDLYNRVHPK